MSSNLTLDANAAAALVRNLVQETQISLPLPAVQQVDSKGAYVDVVFSLTQLYNSGGTYTQEISGGFELHCLSLSSFSSAIFQVAFDSDEWLDVAGGQAFIGYFRQAKLRLNPAYIAPLNPGSGNPYTEAFVKFRIVRKPSKKFLERGVKQNNGGSKVYYLPQAGSATTTNYPTLVTQGAPLTGVTSIRFFANGYDIGPLPATITGGQFRIWLYDAYSPITSAQTNGWYPTDLVISVSSPAGGAYAKFASSEIPVNFSNHRIYIAGESLTGCTYCDVYLYTNGGNGNS
jgi:hypothetical protein